MQTKSSIWLMEMTRKVHFSFMKYQAISRILKRKRNKSLKNFGEEKLKNVITLKNKES